MLAILVLIWYMTDASWTFEYVFRTISQISLDDSSNIYFGLCSVALSSTAMSLLLYLQHPTSWTLHPHDSMDLQQDDQAFVFPWEQVSQASPIEGNSYHPMGQQFPNSEVHYMKNCLLMIKARQVDCYLKLLISLFNNGPRLRPNDWEGQPEKKVKTAAITAKIADKNVGD